MARLTAVQVRQAKHRGKTSSPERRAAGGDLYLQITAKNRKSWAQVVRIKGRRRNIGLGSYPEVSLKEARELALENRRLALKGVDPVAEREGRRLTPTFEAAAEKVIAIRRATWKPGGTTEKGWRSNLGNHVLPRIGKKPVGDVSFEDVRNIVLPLWRDNRATAEDVNNRIAAVLEWAVVEGHRVGNPAGKTLLKQLPASEARGRGHPSVPWMEAPAALAALRGDGGVRRMLVFQALTAVRPTEARLAVWGEIDMEARLWTIPGERMKAGVAHRVPLSPQAAAVLEAAGGGGEADALVFPGRNGKPAAASTARRLFEKHGLRDPDGRTATAHGFRSTFRTWAEENTDFAREVKEAALGHSERNRVVAAYQRSDHLDKRRKLMDAWGAFAGG